MNNFKTNESLIRTFAVMLQKNYTKYECLIILDQCEQIQYLYHEKLVIERQLYLSLEILKDFFFNRQIKLISYFTDIFSFFLDR